MRPEEREVVVRLGARVGRIKSPQEFVEVVFLGAEAARQLGEGGTRFWDIHATMDQDHARWGIEAVAELAAPEDRLIGAARSAADAGWAFLDDRDAAVAILA
jgi:pyrroloquinoline quinone (PQQ) biosynthesis protein C